jgi:hypothetical protein
MTAGEIAQSERGWTLISERERRNNRTCNSDLGEDRSEAMARHADLMRVVYEIAHQLAVLNERNARYESARVKMQEYFGLHREP